MPQLEKILPMLKRVTKSKNGYMACCPAHDDKNPSLSLKRRDDGGVLFNCFGGCSLEDVLAALGLMTQDIMPDAENQTNKTYSRSGSKQVNNVKYFNTAKEAIASISEYKGAYSKYWTYTDCDGKPESVVVRWDTKAGKVIRPVSKTSKGWANKAMDSPRHLYKLPSLDLAEIVYVTEGEKAAGALVGIGLVATTSQGGSKAASKTDWTPLSGKTVVILPDNDDAGERYATDVLKQLAQLETLPKVKIARLPELPDKGDVFDFVGSFKDDKEMCLIAIQACIETAEEVSLTGLIEKPKQQRTTEVSTIPILVCLEDVVSKAVSWLWSNRIAEGKLTMISGDPCLAKSTLTMGIAANVSTGEPWADCPGIRREPGGVVILSAEDDLADTIKPRLQAAGADMKQIVSLKAVRRTCDGAENESMFSLATDMPQLREAIASVENCKLVIIDPISAYLGNADSHKDAQVRALLAPLSDLASDMGVAIISVAHLNKSNGSKAIYRTGGSIAFVAAVRSAYVVIKDPKDPERRLFMPTKSNLAPSDIGGLAYTVEGVNIPIEGGEITAPLVKIEPDIIVGSADDYMGEPDNDSQERDEMVDWLCETISTEGVTHSVEILRLAKQMGFAVKSLRKAFKGLGGKYKKEGFGKDSIVKWILPEIPKI